MRAALDRLDLRIRKILCRLASRKSVSCLFSWAPSEYADRIVLVGVGLSLQNEFLRRIVDRPALEPLEEALAEKRRGIGR